MTLVTRILLVLLVLALAGAAWLTLFRGHVDPPRHVILISLDTLRADRLSLYGHDRDTDSALARLARESVVFETVASQASQTLLSHKSLFAAKYPLRMVHEKTGADMNDLAAIVPETATDFLVSVFSRPRGKSLVGDLRTGGYQTAAFTDGGWLLARFGCNDGFDAYDDRGGHLAGVVPRAKEWVDGNQERPFFLFLHAYDIHKPFWSREPYNSLYCKDHSRHIDLEKRNSGADFNGFELSEADVAGIADHYDGGINSADAYLGDFLDHLRAKGLYDEALIVVVSDHGESLQEHGVVGHGGLYLEQLRVPLVIKFPASHGIAPARIDAPAELVDVMPTILDACDTPPGQVALDGKSLMATVLNGASHRQFLVSQITFRENPARLSNPTKRSIWEPGRWLVIRDERADKQQVFDLAKDPLGLTDVSGRDPERTEALLAQLLRAEALVTSGSFKAPDDVSLDEETRRKLKSLGYLR